LIIAYGVIYIAWLPYLSIPVLGVFLETVQPLSPPGLPALLRVGAALSTAVAIAWLYSLVVTPNLRLARRAKLGAVLAVCGGIVCSMPLAVVFVDYTFALFLQTSPNDIGALLRDHVTVLILVMYPGLFVYHIGVFLLTGAVRASRTMEEEIDLGTSVLWTTALLSAGVTLLRLLLELVAGTAQYWYGPQSISTYPALVALGFVLTIPRLLLIVASAVGWVLVGLSGRD
jgi:hypothetical protein